MKVFISWSGEKSKLVAEYLKELLELIFSNSINVWLSTDSVSPGTHWFSELTEVLEDADFGIVCLTKENTNAKWLLFESGGLFKSVSNAKVIPYLFDLKQDDLYGSPLAQFQAKQADKRSTFEIVKFINELKTKTKDHLIEKQFNAFWGDYEAKLEGIREAFPEGLEEETQEVDDEIVAQKKELVENLAAMNHEYRLLLKDTKEMRAVTQSVSKSLSAINAVYELDLKDKHQHMKTTNRYNEHLAQAMDSMQEISEALASFKNTMENNNPK